MSEDSAHVEAIGLALEPLAWWISQLFATWGGRRAAIEAGFKGERARESESERESEFERASERESVRESERERKRERERARA